MLPAVLVMSRLYCFVFHTSYQFLEQINEGGGGVGVVGQSVTLTLCCAPENVERGLVNAKRERYLREAGQSAASTAKQTLFDSCATDPQPSLLPPLSLDHSLLEQTTIVWKYLPNWTLPGAVTCAYILFLVFTVVCQITRRITPRGNL